MSFQKLLFSLSGRLDRKGFWVGLAIWAPIALPILSLLVVLEMNRSPPGFLEEPPRPGKWQPPEFFVISLIYFYPLVAITSKRLHDRGKSGWWSLPMIVAPVLILFAELPVWHWDHDWSRTDRWSNLTWSPPSLWIGLGAVALALLAWWVIELGTRPGTLGPNRFGPADYRAIGSAKGAAGE